VGELGVMKALQRWGILFNFERLLVDTKSLDGLLG